MLWVDKYRPVALSKMHYHTHLSLQLQKLVESRDFPHLLFYGPPGAGKKTRIIAFLRELYGPSVEKLKAEKRQVQKANSSQNVEIMIVSSLHHLELNPSSVGHQDRHVVQEVLKEIASNQPLDASAERSFKVVVLNEADRMTKEAQHALRRTMEKFTSACRIVMVCNNLGKIIDPLRSRCLCVRVPAPTNEEIVNILQLICKKESLTLPSELANEIVNKSERNLRRAILSLEACKVKQYPFQANQTVDLPDWEEYIRSIARQILDEQSPRCLQVVRGKLYELLSHCIPPDVIMRTLAFELLKKLDSEVKFEVTYWAAHYEHQMQTGSKAILHLEAFIAKFMSIYAKFIMYTLGY